MTTGEKLPFDIDIVLARVREAIQPFPKAAMFQLFDEGYRSLFEQLIACIISIRTYDETTVLLAHNLFDQARTPDDILHFSREQITEIIRRSTFAEAKAGQILEIARHVMDEFSGELPCDRHTLLSFRGVGIKCANLALGIACNQPYIAVDIHVHRVTNRWGYVRSPNPERTTVALEERLPREYWIEINRLLVPFGKHICTGTLPWCSTCPVLAWCKQVGVSRYR